MVFSKVLKLSIIFFMFSVISFAGQADFRNIRWGMTKIEVMANEKDKPEAFAGPTLMYRTPMLGKEMFLIYGFIENKLIDAMYVFLMQNDQEYLEVLDILTKKYHFPTIKRDEGPMDYFFMWDTEMTEVVLRPGPGKECRIEYLSKKLKKYRKKLETKTAVEKQKELMKFF